jgi:D-alanyl-D-alanine carboxypeptidase/D-alanyl-D-alanine-endopeptidase (penicillin-binding protein 4)
MNRMRDTTRSIVAALGAALFVGGCAGGASSTAPTPARSPNSVAALRAAIDSMIGQPQWRTARWGILVVDPERHDTLYAHDADKLFIPASNQKIVTGSVALVQLGPDFRFSTTFVADGPIANGTLTGDLVVNGTADPSLSDAMRGGDAMGAMREIADSVAARGITRITGALRPGIDALPGPTIGEAWSWDYLDDDYAAGVDELFFNEGFSRVYVRGAAQPGDAPTVTTAPAHTYPPVRVLATTAPAGTRRRLRLAMDSTVRGGVVLEGTIAAGDSARVTVAFRDPPGSYLSALREALTARGIAVDGGVISTRDAAAASAQAASYEPRGTPLFTIASPPLSEIMRPFEKPSQNQIAEILLRTVGRVKTGVGTADSGLRVVRRQLDAWGVAPDGIHPVDGSGMSREDVVSPETLVRVLDAMTRQPTFDIFYQALPIAGVDGTIRSRMLGTPAQGNVHAKTGSLDMVRSLSGYVTTATGRRLIFSVLCNHYLAPSPAVTGLADAIAARLAALELR